MSSYRVLVPFVIVGLLSSPIDAKEPPKTTGKKAPPAAKEKTPPEGHTPDPKDRATKLAKEGAELARNGRYQDAAAKFQQSLAIYPIVDVYYNLGYCYEEGIGVTKDDSKAVHWYTLAAEQGFLNHPRFFIAAASHECFDRIQRKLAALGCRWVGGYAHAT